MSSHHIIRDEQEPPVLIFQIHDNWQELSEILGWSPILLISPSLKEVFDFKKIKVDGYIDKQEGLISTGEKNFIYNDQFLGKSLLDWMISKNCTAINIFCDYTLLIDLFQQLKAAEVRVPLIFFTENGKYILKPNSFFKKWYPEKAEIGILNDKIKNLVNLKAEKDGFKVEKAGFIIIEVEENLVFLKEK